MGWCPHVRQKRPRAGWLCQSPPTSSRSGDRAGCSGAGGPAAPPSSSEHFPRTHGQPPGTSQSPGMEGLWGGFWKGPWERQQGTGALGLSAPTPPPPADGLGPGGGYCPAAGLEFCPIQALFLVPGGRGKESKERGCCSRWGLGLERVPGPAGIPEKAGTVGSEGAGRFGGARGGHSWDTFYTRGAHELPRHAEEEAPQPQSPSTCSNKNDYTARSALLPRAQPLPGRQSPLSTHHTADQSGGGGQNNKAHFICQVTEAQGAA